MPSVAIYTLGCKVNQADSAAMAELFKKSGYTIVDFSETADVYVINTCVVTNVGEKKSRQIIRRAVRQNPSALVAVAGCYPQTAAGEVGKIPGVRLVVGNNQCGDIVSLVEKARLTGQVTAVENLSAGTQFEELVSGQVENRTRAFLKIQEGCNQFCTYCIIPYARGPLRSRPLANILAEAKMLTEQGFNEIVLIGIHLGAYGVETPGGPRLAEAVEAVLSLPGVARVRLGSLESIEVSPRLVQLMQSDGRLCRHLHLPLQSGCDAVLKSMNRPYSTKGFAALAENLRKVAPGLALTTDVIVGFPGETEDMFMETVEFVRVLDFAKVHIFPFSPRRGTPAEKFPGQVDESIKNERVAVLAQAAEVGRRRFLSGMLGREADVLFEQKEGNFLQGFSGNYVKVFVKAEQDLSAAIKKVKIKEFYRDGLLGELT